MAKLLGIPLEQTVKSIVLATEGDKGQVQIWLLMLRGDHELNEIKAGKLPGLAGFRFATESEIVEHFGCKPGYLGPVGTARPVRVVADRTVAHMADFVCGANKEHFHIQGVNWAATCPSPSRSPTCATWSPATLARRQGHAFHHARHRSRTRLLSGQEVPEALKATFLDETGKPATLEMGCYGIGVTRIVGAAIEQNHDARGIIWPRAIAPFEVVICPVGWGKVKRCVTPHRSSTNRCWRAAWTSSWTTATPVPASCSPSGN